MKEKLINEIKRVDELIVRNMRLLVFYAGVEDNKEAAKMFKKIACDTEQLFEFRAKFSYILASQFKIYGM